MSVGICGGYGHYLTYNNNLKLLTSLGVHKIYILEVVKNETGRSAIAAGR